MANLWRQVDGEDLEHQIAEVLERFGASEQVASDCADEVRGLLVRVPFDEAVERMLPALQGFFDEWDGATRRPADDTLRSLAHLGLRAALGGLYAPSEQQEGQ